MLMGSRGMAVTAVLLSIHPKQGMPLTLRPQTAPLLN